MKPRKITFAVVFMITFAAISNSSAENVEIPLGTNSVCASCEKVLKDVVALRSTQCNLVKHPEDIQPNYVMPNDELFSFLMVVDAIASPKDYQMVLDKAEKNVDCDNTANWISQILKAA